MKKGNWAPICKSIVQYFPKAVGPPYTKPEAIMCIQIDYDNNKVVSNTGYAKLWKWSRRQVKNLMDELGIFIQYPKNTGNYKNQRGLISGLKADEKRANTGLMRFIDSKDISKKPDEKRTKSGLKADESVDTTNDPIKPDPKPDPKPKPKKKIFVEDSNEFRLALFMLNHIQKNKPDFKEPDLQSWSRDADLVLRVDKRNLETCKKLILWISCDSFENTKVLSISKLRKRFDYLEMEMNKPKNIQRNKKESRTLRQILDAGENNNPNDIEITDYEIS